MVRAPLTLIRDRSALDLYPVERRAKKRAASGVRRLLRLTRPNERAARVDTLAPALGILTGLLAGVALWLAILLPLYLYLR